MMKQKLCPMNSMYQPCMFDNHSLANGSDLTAILHLILQRFCIDSESRLGHHHGLEEIKQHPFFRGVDWEHIRDRPSGQPFLSSSLIALDLPAVEQRT